MPSKKIAIIVTWFGKLPVYFPAWLISAESNIDIDFLVFSDQIICSESPNIKSYQLSMHELLKMFQEKMGRIIKIQNSYKFCDCRPFFGITFSDYLKEYDFWGYCDIDLVFGNIRKFVTDEKMSKYDRFYQYGHLSIFRNVDTINHLYDLPGGIYTYDEILCGEAKTTPEEYLGINRICQKNNIKWYTEIDFADFSLKYENRLELVHGRSNSKHQVFAWSNGEAYRLYEEDNEIKKEEFVYIHWQKRKPIISGEIDHNSTLLIGPKTIEVSDKEIDVEKMDLINPCLNDLDRKQGAIEYKKKKRKEFLNANFATKKMWIRQKAYSLITKRTYE